MPAILRYKGYKFFFFSNEGLPREPVHVHVQGQGGLAKIWIEPEVTAAHSSGIPAKTMRELVRFVAEHRDYFIDMWKEYFDD
ncbi:protein of unknown function [Duganella sp. CF517]|jgi:hypothetical protein|uniref:DUF4160 domain-containing protein n=1 Tax=Duganella sp. CF517 TaxID=1881038 RepID=UPI0008AF4B5D|nr:DUF4160 domain-containing protein [Duganella sp. CF517]SEO51273.1 protein of unknown function [Duganella sp. CF517]